MDQVINLIKLRWLVTVRTYTKSAQTRIESLFFFSLFLLAMLTIYNELPYYLYRSTYYIPAMVMTFDYFFLAMILLWMTIPIMGFRLNESLEIKKLIHYPISFPVLYIALFLGNFIDISSLVPITILASLTQFFWITDAREGIIGVVLLCVIVFLFLQMVYQTMVLLLYNLLPRFNPLKIVAFFLASAVIVLVLMNVNIIQVPTDSVIFDDENLKYHNLLPSGTFGITAYEFYVGNLSLGWNFLGKSFLWLIPVALLNFIISYLTYRGLELGLVRSTVKTKRFESGDSSRVSRFDKILSRPVMAIFVKDMQAFLRDWHYMFYKMMPGIVTPTMVLLIVRFQLLESELMLDPYTRRIFQTFFIIVVVILFLAQAYIFVGNLFGYDRSAISILFTAPIDNRSIIIGKNLFIFMLLTIDCLVISLLLFLFYGEPRIPLTFFFILESSIIILLSITNFCSMIFPFYVPLDKPSVSFQGTFIVGLMNLITDLILGIFMVPVIVGFYYVLSLESTPLLVMAFAMSLIYALSLYMFLLKYSSRMLDRYRESIYHSVSSP